jgi:hypothetical protein
LQQSYCRNNEMLHITQDKSKWFHDSYRLKRQKNK